MGTPRRFWDLWAGIQTAQGVQSGSWEPRAGNKKDDAVSGAQPAAEMCTMGQTSTRRGDAGAVQGFLGMATGTPASQWRLCELCCSLGAEHGCSSQQSLDAAPGTSPLLAAVPWLTAPLGTNPARAKQEGGWGKGWGRGLPFLYTLCFLFPAKSPPLTGERFCLSLCLKQRAIGEGRQVEQEGAPGGTQQGWQIRKMGRKTQSGGSWGGEGW